MSKSADEILSDGIKEGLVELLGTKEEKTWRENLIAYHAVPGQSLTAAKLATLRGPDRVLEAEPSTQTRMCSA